jgi:TonB family protein
MRTFAVVFLLVAGTSGAFAQAALSTNPPMPTDPKGMLAAAAPMYDFSAATLKPWHVKASYQVYDGKGDPAGKGTYEYWWASPDVYRSTWTREAGAHTDWHTADGKHAYEASGERVNYFEFKLQSALFSPLPDAADLDPKTYRLERQMAPMGKAKMPCVMVIRIMPQHGQVQSVPLGLFPTYCFDPDAPVLRVSYSLGSMTTVFDHIVKVQGRYLPEKIDFFEGARKILTATVDGVNGIAASDPALLPPSEAAVRDAKPSSDKVVVQDLKKVTIAGGVAQGFLFKKEVPVYPQDAKDARVQGTVVLQATIGTDGGIHDLKVISGPWPSLIAAALWSVSHWTYKPYLLNGEPVEVETTVNVVFSLGS